MNFSVGVILKINPSPRHIRSGTVLKYVWEDGDGRELTEMRPLGGAGRVVWRVLTALPHLTSHLAMAHMSPCSCWAQAAVQAKDKLLAQGSGIRVQIYRHVTMCTLRICPLQRSMEPPPCQHRRDLSPPHGSRSATISCVISQQFFFIFAYSIWALPTPLLPPFRVISLPFLLLVVWHTPFLWRYNKAQPGSSPLCWALWKEEKK